jgi:ribosomal 50S subunit-associated protein YjgA (DUF615 family)
MKRLSKTQEKTKAELIEALGKAAETVREALETVNTAIEANLNPAIETYNNALTEVETFRDEIVGEMDNYYNERSDNWRDGDAGSNYTDWKGEWEGLDISEVEAVEQIDEPTLNHGEEVDALATEVSQ